MNEEISTSVLKKMETQSAYSSCSRLVRVRLRINNLMESVLTWRTGSYCKLVFNNNLIYYNMDPRIVGGKHNLSILLSNF